MARTRAHHSQRLISLASSAVALSRCRAYLHGAPSTEAPWSADLGLAAPFVSAIRTRGRPSTTCLPALGYGNAPDRGKDDPEYEGTRVEQALRISSRQMRALQRLLEEQETVTPPPNDPPQFPPAQIELPAPSFEAMEADKTEIQRINKQFYDSLNDHNIRGVMSLWREEGAVQMYMNEDKIIPGHQEIDKYLEKLLRNTWGTTKHLRRSRVEIEDERVFLRGINAFVTNKEVWETIKTKEKKVLFSTKVLMKYNGAWWLVHAHAGDGSQIEVNSQGQMRLPNGAGVTQAGTGQAGQGQIVLGGQSIQGLLGGGNAAQGTTGPQKLEGLLGGSGAEGTRVFTTPEGYRIIVSGQGGLGSLLGQGGQAGALGGKDGTKDLILKALIADLIKNGKENGAEVIPLQIGAGRSGAGGAELVSALDGSDSRANRRSNGSQNKDGSNGGNKENLTKKTVAAVRQLCKEGRISVIQKQKLIFSVIRSTKQEEASQAEMAYDLLVENALAGEENAMDEFADQCTIIAERCHDDDDEDSDDEEEGAFFEEGEEPPRSSRGRR